MYTVSIVGAVFGIALVAPALFPLIFGPPIWLVVRHRRAVAAGETPPLWGIRARMTLCNLLTFLHVRWLTGLLGFDVPALMMAATTLGISLIVYYYDGNELSARTD